MLKYAASPAAAVMLSTTVTPEPSASHDRAGCRRRGAWSKSTAMVKTRTSSPSGHRPHCHQRCVALRPAVLRDHRVAEGSARHEHEEAQPDGHREDGGEDRGPAVLGERGSVPADAVDAVAAALDLRHRRRHGEGGEEESDDQRDLPGVLRAVREGVHEGVVSAGRGRDGVDGRGHDPRRPLIVDVGREAHHREQERQDREAGLQGQRPAVGEAVAVAEPDERVDQDRAQAVAPGEVPGVLGVELVAVHLRRHRDGAGGGHGETLCGARTSPTSSVSVSLLVTPRSDGQGGHGLGRDRCGAGRRTVPEDELDQLLHDDDGRGDADADAPLGEGQCRSCRRSAGGSRVR